MKIGLVLEGGANRGVFTSGVLDYFMEQDLGKAFRYVIGTSAGAGNAMNFISGQHGRSRDTTITKDKRYAYFGLKNIIRTGHLFDMENIYWRVPTEYNLFDFDAYFRNPIEREYTATNCLTGQAEYLTDYAKPDTSQKGFALIERELLKVEDEKRRCQCAEAISAVVHKGERDLRF